MSEYKCWDVGGKYFAETMGMLEKLLRMLEKSHEKISANIEDQES
jgi:hypothetical protein